MRELSEFDYFKAWLLFFVIATAAGAIVGLAVGIFLAALLGASGATAQEIMNTNRILGFIVALPISYITFRAVVGKFLFPKLWDNDETEEKRPD
jgi:hypothetical protein